MAKYPPAYFNGEISPDSPANQSVTLTVGSTKDAMFSSLDNALAYRDTKWAAMIAAPIASTTGSIAYTDYEDHRNLIISPALPAGVVSLNGNLGVRIGGAGNPVLPCILTGTNRAFLLAPIASTWAAGTKLDFYDIVPYGIMIMPGENISLENSSTRVIPPYTTIACTVPLGASISYESATGGDTFVSRDDQNHIYFKNLILRVAFYGINSTFWKIPTGSSTNNQTLCDYGIYDCDCGTTAQDFLYTSAGECPSGSLHLHRNTFFGTYDIVNPGVWRLLDVQSNTINMVSRGDFKDDAGDLVASGDGGVPTGLVFGGLDTSTYPSINVNIVNNIFNIWGAPFGGLYGAQPVGVEIRSALPSVAVIDIKNNQFTINKFGGTSAHSNPYAVYIRDSATGTNTPTINVIGNTINSVLTNSAAGVAYSMQSENPYYIINTHGNLIINGAAGANTRDLSSSSVTKAIVGAGITSGTGTICKNGVAKVGDIITTTYLIDLTGLSSSTTDLDIIGNSTGAAYFGQIRTANNGTILSGRMTCLEAPAGGVTDIDVYAATEATGVFDAAISGLVEVAQLTSGAAWTIGRELVFTAVPAADKYLYLTCGAAGTAATYTAGKFLIELNGYVA